MPYEQEFAKIIDETTKPFADVLDSSIELGWVNSIARQYESHFAEALDIGRIADTAAPRALIEPRRMELPEEMFEVIQSPSPWRERAWSVFLVVLGTALGVIGTVIATSQGWL